MAALGNCPPTVTVWKRATVKGLLYLKHTTEWGSIHGCTILTVIVKVIAAV